MLNVLVVCHGNVNRSPACAQVLKDLDDGARRLHVQSAALKSGKLDKRATLKCRDAMTRRLHSVLAHAPQPCTNDLVQWADAVIYMDSGNLRRLRRGFRPPRVSTRVVCLGHLIDENRIADPAFLRRGSPECEGVFDQIVEASRRLYKELTDERAS